jgi:glucose/mannose transport system substrate-binding protein
MFNLISDTFALPKNAPHRDNAIRWLTFLGSVEGQDVFNSVKDSIPARFDCDMANPRLYNVYQQATAADFRQAVLKSGLVGSLIGGAVAPGEFTGDFIQIVDAFTRDRRVDAAARAAQQLADRVGSLR